MRVHVCWVKSCGDIIFSGPWASGARRTHAGWHIYGYSASPMFLRAVWIIEERELNEGMETFYCFAGILLQCQEMLVIKAYSMQTFSFFLSVLMHSIAYTKLSTISFFPMSLMISFQVYGVGLIGSFLLSWCHLVCFYLHYKSCSQ